MAFSDSHGRSGKAEETIEYFSSAGVADLSRSDTVVLHNAIDFPDRALLLDGCCLGGSRCGRIILISSSATPSATRLVQKRGAMAIPATMNVVDVTRFGGPEVLALAKRAVPLPGAEEVLVKVSASGVNRADIMQREGNYPPPSGASKILGLEVSGTVVATGKEVTTWSVGDHVCALVSGGGYAEFCAVPAKQCLPIPQGISLTDAAALPEAFFTVWTNVVERGRLSNGETFLVHGGSSGIGTAAIQLAKRIGCRVFATAGSSEKCAACERLGADKAINYRDEDFVSVVKSVTNGSGVDLVLDMVGGPYLNRNLECLGVEGRLVVIALMEGAKAELDLADVMSRRLFVTGSTLRSRSVEQKAVIAESLLANVWPEISSGHVQPVVFATYPFSGAAIAHQTMEASTHIGKILLLP